MACRSTRNPKRAGREEARSKPLVGAAADAIADFRKIKSFWG
jgi:hypothetical protein